MLTCQQSPPGKFLLAIRQFNARQWYECHETIEQLWLAESGEMRAFLQGILQVAVALNHWRNGNHSGAISLLSSGVKYLSQVPDVCLWVDVSTLIKESEAVRLELEVLGKEGMDTLNQQLIPVIKTVSVP